MTFSPFHAFGFENKREEPRLSSPVSGRVRSTDSLQCANHCEDVALNSANIQLDVANLSYHVERDGKTKFILQDVNLRINSGEMCAFMGPAGCGKSTLINMIADRVKEGGWSGDLLLNRIERPPWFTRVMAFVEMKDVLVPTMTVRESLRFAAFMRMPATATGLEREQRVAAVMQQFSLTEVENRLIRGAATFSASSSGMIRNSAERIYGQTMRITSGGRGAGMASSGLSVFQRKLLSIAQEVVGLPRLLILDEPTTGLADSEALQLANMLRVYTNPRRICLCTIDQPSSASLALFDRLVLLSAGRVVYSGPIDRIVTHFQGIGFPYQFGTNPGEYVIHVCGDGKVSPAQLQAAFENAELYQVPHTREDPTAGMVELIRLHKPTNPRLILQLVALVLRGWKMWIRDTEKLKMEFFINVFCGLLIGVTFYDQGDSPPPYFSSNNEPTAALSNFTAALFVCILYLYFYHALSVPDMFMINQVYRKEVEKNLYSPLAYWIVTLVVQLPVQLFMFTGFITLMYPLCGFRSNDSEYFIFFYTLLFLAFIAPYYIFQAAVIMIRNYRSAFAVVTPIFMFCRVFAGYSIILGDIPSWLGSWATVLNYMRWVFAALLINQYEQEGALGEEVIAYYEFDRFQKYNAIYITGLLTLVPWAVMLWGLQKKQSTLKKDRGFNGFSQHSVGTPGRDRRVKDTMGAGRGSTGAGGLVDADADRDIQMVEAQSGAAETKFEQACADASSDTADVSSRSSKSALLHGNLSSSIISLCRFVRAVCGGRGAATMSRPPVEHDLEDPDRFTSISYNDFRGSELGNASTASGMQVTIRALSCRIPASLVNGTGGPTGMRGSMLAADSNDCVTVLENVCVTVNPGQLCAVMSPPDGGQGLNSRFHHRALLDAVAGKLPGHHSAGAGVLCRKAFTQQGYAQVLGPLCQNSTRSVMALSDGDARAVFAQFMTGRVLYNGSDLNLEILKSISYVKSQDVHIALLSVYETVLFAARLRLADRFVSSTSSSTSDVNNCGESASAEDLHGLVRQVIEMVGLTAHSAKLVGNHVVSGLTRAETRRLTIATEMVTLPSLLVLQEPAAGLDVATSLETFAALKNLAAQNRTIMCSLERPPSGGFDMFDVLVLLSDSGRVVYSGSAAGAVNFFEASPYGLRCDLMANSADFLLAVAAGEARPRPSASAEAVADEAVLSAGRGGAPSAADSLPVSAQQLVEYFALTSAANPDASTFAPLPVNDELLVVSIGLAQATGEWITLFGISLPARKNAANLFVLQYTILLERYSMLTYRNWKPIVIALVRALVLGIMLGAAFMEMPDGDSFSAYLERYSFSFLALFFIAVAQVHTIPLYHQEVLLFKREMWSDLYHPLAFYLASSTTYLVFFFVHTAIFVCIAYFVADVTQEAGAALFFLLSLYLSAVCGYFISQMIAATTDSLQNAMGYYLFVVFVDLIFAGYYQAIPNMQSWLGTWIPYVSFMRWSYQAMVAIELTENPSLTQGDYYLKSLDFDIVSPLGAVGIQIAVTFAYGVAACFILARKKT